MRRLRFVIVLALVVGAGAVALLVWRTPREAQPVVINNTPAPPVPTLEPVRVAHGARLYAENCAGCHGANLEGAPNWKQWLPDGSLPPPPHDSSGHTWHHPDALLLDITRNGGDRASGSRMPAFGERLSEDETTAILDFIKSKWGREEREFQWWITATSDGS